MSLTSCLPCPLLTSGNSLNNYQVVPRKTYGIDKDLVSRNREMIYPFDPEEGLPFDEEEGLNYLFSRRLEDYTLTGKLRRFHESFDSSTRAILQDCLFRIHEDKGIIMFQILCPNAAVQKRLYRKREKVRQTLRWIWRDLDYYAFCIEHEGLQCQVLDLHRYQGGV